MNNYFLALIDMITSLFVWLTGFSFEIPSWQVLVHCTRAAPAVWPWWRHF